MVPALKRFSDSVVVSHTLTEEIDQEKMSNERKKDLLLLVFPIAGSAVA